MKPPTSSRLIATLGPPAAVVALIVGGSWGYAQAIAVGPPGRPVASSPTASSSNHGGPDCHAHETIDHADVEPVANSISFSAIAGQQKRKRERFGHFQDPEGFHLLSSLHRGESELWSG